MCGYYFDLCRTNFYKTLKTSDYYDTVYANNAESDDLKKQNENNNFLDGLYAKQRQGAPFKILWLSDLNIDLNYVYESSSQCLDLACCHKDNIPESDDQKAGLFGNKNCNLPLDGFVKMIDSINALNNTQDFDIASIIIGGSATANVPGYTTKDQIVSTQKQVF